MINSKQRSKLRSLAHHLKPVVNIGESGITEGSISSIDEALESHELIKVKFIQNKESKHKFKSEIEKLFSASIVGDIGNTIILFREHRDEEKRKYNIR